jgi:predicted ATPase
MIQDISLLNFKGFQSLDTLTIRPITVLCGTNSCGKSSILQSLLLLKQTFESQDPNQTLLLNGRFVHLGAFENLIFHKLKDTSLQLALTCLIKRADFNRAGSRTMPPLHFWIRDLVPPEAHADRKADFQLTYNVAMSQPKTRKSKYLKPVLIERMSYRLSATLSDGRTLPGASLELVKRPNEFYSLTWHALPRRYRTDTKEPEDGTTNARIEFANLMPKGLVIEADESKPEDRPDLFFMFRRFNDMLRTVMSSLTYLGPLREEPSRRYIYEDEVVEVGTKGENAAYLVLAEHDNTIVEHYFYDAATDGFVARKRCKLGHALDEWLRLMGITGFRAEPTNEIIYLNLDAEDEGKTRVSIADVGFGVSQIFPVILEGLKMPVRNTLLLEQPEIHLHPDLQMELADFFVALALSGKRISVETHSDHIVNRLVRRIVEDETDRMQKLISIYVIRKTGGAAECEEVRIDDTRGITNWPPGLFDQTAKEQERIIIAGLKKRKRGEPMAESKQ